MFVIGYCTTSDVIEIKGRIACELSSADELLLTEMMFNGLFNPLNPPQVILIWRLKNRMIGGAGGIFNEEEKKS